MESVCFGIFSGNSALHVKHSMSTMSSDEEMSVGHIAYNNQVYDAHSGDKVMVEHIEPTSADSETRGLSKEDAGWKAAMRVVALCNRADDESTKPGEPGLQYDAVLSKYAEQQLGNVAEYRARYKKLAEIPFNTTIEWSQLSIHELPDDADHLLLVMKGSLEEVPLTKATWSWLIDGEEKEMDETAQWNMVFNAIHVSEQCERAIALFDYKLPRADYPPGFKFNTVEPNFPVKGLRFVGMISVKNPLPVSLPKTVAKCRSADIRVILFTGAWRDTAKAIAKSVGIFSEDSETVEDVKRRRSSFNVDESEARACIMHGDWLRNYMKHDGNNEWAMFIDGQLSLHEEIVFCRTSPDQQRIIIDLLRQRDKVIAICGRGIDAGPIALC